MDQPDARGLNGLASFRVRQHRKLAASLLGVAAPGQERVVHDGATVVFCSAHCRAQFEAEPERYSGLRAP